LAGHIKLASADSQLIHVYLNEYNACHQSSTSSFSIISSYHVSQKLIQSPDPPLANLAFWFPMTPMIKFSNDVVL